MIPDPERNRSRPAIAVARFAIVATTALALAGCFTMREQYAAAWGTPRSKADKNKALAADIVTAPIQAPLLVPALMIGAVASARDKPDEDAGNRAAGDVPGAAGSGVLPEE